MKILPKQVTFDAKDTLALFLTNSVPVHSFTFFKSNSKDISLSIESAFKNISDNKKNSFPDDSVYNKSEGVI